MRGEVFAALRAKENARFDRWMMSLSQIRFFGIAMTMETP